MASSRLEAPYLPLLCRIWCKPYSVVSASTERWDSWLCSPRLSWLALFFSNQFHVSLFLPFAIAVLLYIFFIYIYIRIIFSTLNLRNAGDFSRSEETKYFVTRRLTVNIFAMKIFWSIIFYLSIFLTKLSSKK